MPAKPFPRATPMIARTGGVTLLTAVAWLTTACGEMATLPVSAGTGPRPISLGG